MGVTIKKLGIIATKNYSNLYESCKRFKKTHLVIRVFRNISQLQFKRKKLELVSRLQRLNFKRYQLYLLGPFQTRQIVSTSFTRQ